MTRSAITRPATLRRRRLLVAGMVIGLGLAPLTATAAPNVTCGQVLTDSVVLSENLTCLRGESLPSIGADGVVFDLGGHTIDATLADFPDAIINPGFDNVTITNGTIIQGSVWIQGAQRNVVSNLFLDGNEHEIRLTDTSRSRILDNFLRDSDIWLVRSHDNVLIGNKVQASNVSPGGINLQDSNRNTLRSNETLLNVFDGFVIDGDDNKLIANRSTSNDDEGFVIVAGSRRTMLRGNMGDGFVVQAGAIGTKLIGNTAQFSSVDGFRVDEPRTTVIHNTSVDNALFGYRFVPGVKAAGNYAANNGSGNCLGCGG